MAYESFPNEAHNDREITLAENEQLLVPLGASGLIGYTGTAPVYADSTGRQVKLRAGVSATIRGTRFNNTSETVIDNTKIVANSSGNPRIDLLVLRLDREAANPNAYTISPVVITGTAAATPIAPQPVRDTPLDATGYYDLPLAEITVVNGATTIAANQVVNRAWWVSPSGYSGFDAAKPPAEPGAVFRANDTAISYLGTSGGSWRSFDRDTGKVLLSSIPAGWVHTSGGIRVRRTGQTVILTIAARRTGATVGNGTASGIGFVPVGMRPDGEIADGIYTVKGSGHSSNISVDPNTGGVYLQPDNVHQIASGAYVIGQAMWHTAA